jgi:hypothetical protein
MAKHQMDMTTMSAEDRKAFYSRPGRTDRTGYPYDLGRNVVTQRRDVNLPVERKKPLAKPRSMSKR